MSDRQDSDLRPPDYPVVGLTLKYCLVSREIAGDVNVPGGSLVDDEVVFALHMPPFDADLTLRRAPVRVAEAPC